MQQPIWLLVSGPARSGTTLLQQVLNSHPTIACLHEYGLRRLIENTDRFFIYSDIGAPDPPLGQEKLAESTNIDQFYHRRSILIRAHLGDEFLAPRRARDRSRILAAIYAVLSNKSGLTVYGDKSPNQSNIDEIERLREELEQSLKRLYIVRNPEDTIVSSMHRAERALAGLDTWHIQNIQGAINEWVQNWEHIANDSARYPGEVLVVKYEELIYNFNKTVEEIANFLGVSRDFKNFTSLPPDSLKESRLSEKDARLVKNIVGPLAEEWTEHSVSWMLKVCPLIFPEVPLNVDFRIVDNPVGWFVFRRGFCNFESGGVWTSGNRAIVRFRIPKLATHAQAKFAMRFNCFWDASEKCDFVVKINDLASVPVQISKPATAGLMHFEQPLPPDRETIEIVFEIPNPKTPDQPPVSDHRAVGLRLESIRITA